MSLSALPYNWSSSTSAGPHSFIAADSLDGVSHGSNATCSHCGIIIPRNVSRSTHEVSCPFLRTRSTPKDGRPSHQAASNDNSARSSSGSATAPRSSRSPQSHPDSAMSEVASTTVSPHSPGNSVDTDVSPAGASRRYHLEIVQHPERTAEIGMAAVLSRLPLSPPLVVKMTVEDEEGHEIPAHTEMPFLAAHLLLYNEDGTEQIDLVDAPSSPGGTEPQRMLYGTLVSSLHSLNDLSRRPGMFFIFPDVSVRRRGRYTLLVNLLRLTAPADPMAVMPVGNYNTALASVRTDPFNVVEQSGYNAPAATELTNCFHRQGARMYTPFQPR